MSDLRQIIFFLCSGKEEPGDDLKEELAIFFQNSGAVTGFICFHDSVLQIIPHPGKNPDFSPNIIPVSSFKTDGIITEHALIAEELSQYLENLHKIVSRIFYQIFGENEKNSVNGRFYQASWKSYLHISYLIMVLMKMP